MTRVSKKPSESSLLRTSLFLHYPVKIHCPDLNTYIFSPLRLFTTVTSSAHPNRHRHQHHHPYLSLTHPFPILLIFLSYLYLCLHNKMLFSKLALLFTVAFTVSGSPVLRNVTAKRYAILDNDWGSTGFIPFLMALEAGIDILALTSCTHCSSRQLFGF